MRLLRLVRLVGRSTGGRQADRERGERGKATTVGVQATPACRGAKFSLLRRAAALCAAYSLLAPSTFFPAETPDDEHQQGLSFSLFRVAGSPGAWAGSHRQARPHERAAGQPAGRLPSPPEACWCARATEREPLDGAHEEGRL